MAKKKRVLPDDEEDILLFWCNKDNPEQITCPEDHEDRYSILFFPKEVQTLEEKMNYITTCLHQETPMRATYLYKAGNGDLVDGGLFSCRLINFFIRTLVRRETETGCTFRRLVGLGVGWQ